MDTQRRKDRGMSTPIAIRRSRLARSLVLGAALAAMSLGATAAHAQPLSDHDGGQAIRHRERVSQEPVGITAAEQAFRHRERVSRDPAATAGAEQAFRHDERVSQDQPTAPTPVEVTAPVRLAEPSSRHGWLVPALGMGVAALALLGGLTLLAARRTRIKFRPRQAA
jgi:hypothetical protein